jgi:multiple sugar transport system permease protein
MGHGVAFSCAPFPLGKTMTPFVTSLKPEKKNSSNYQYNQRNARRRRVTFLCLVAPAMLWFLSFMLWPLLNMFYISTMRWDGLNLPKKFIFLDNFIRIFHDPKIIIALRNTGTYLLVGILGIIPLAFMLGFFLSLRKPGFRLLRTIFFSPAMLSVAALAMIFLGIYRPDGMLNTLLNSLGLSALTRVWLGNKATALGALIAIDIWGGIGFNSVLFFAALASLPEELYEAAMLDGAGYWTIMWKIAFPLMLDFIGVVSVLQFLAILSGAAYMILLTGGGPGTATFTLGYYLYDQAFLSHRLGYSQAMGVMLFFIGIIAIVLIRRITSRLSD